MTDPEAPAVRRDGDRIILPGLATAHSHAFQRALRGRTQRRGAEVGSFWSWRGLMYRLAEQLTPDDVLHLSRLAFIELALSGVTAVGEFHYLHHAPGGVPYTDRLAMAEAVIQAATEVGVRLTLIRAVYQRGGYGQALEPAQRRFADDALDKVVDDVETLQRRYAGNPLIRVALAAHSVRAVPLPGIVELSQYAQQRGLMFHMHVAEQRAEVAMCQQEYGRRPVEVLADNGILRPRFVAVHATHLTAEEIGMLGGARAMVCLCRTTERDLGDGLPATGALVTAGVRLCVGVDSHAAPDAFEEIRAVELDERGRTETRHAALDADGLLLAATAQGYDAIGQAEARREDEVALDADDPALAGAEDAWLTDAVVFGATARSVREVRVAGRRIVEAGQHPGYQAARDAYRRTMRKLDINSAR